MRFTFRRCAKALGLWGAEVVEGDLSSFDALCHRLLGWPTSETGTLCHGDGTQGRGEPRRGMFVLYAPAPTGDLLPGFYRRTASNVLQPEPRSMAPTSRVFCVAL